VSLSYELSGIGSWLIVSACEPGVEVNVRTMADFAPLYPPCNWIPASAGMTDYARITGKLFFVRAACRGVQRGEAPATSYQLMAVEGSREVNDAAERCRESEGVPQTLSLSCPPRLGVRGLINRYETAVPALAGQPDTPSR
jgi:hypothetical protein